ncbi:hypothetical protein PPL_11805 [Heterostelium album PN500]|uniref:Uncharacterized protein n=1 Tax=Heterostelium pallidum (strain ATCC 26659 / Pp 5 / PN500) TaxID=670386 RepID=D3BUI5_HETP5|nr:hypothetical protein PPL_11805 [Heterostelium album PN500]EFA74773.1 hypothetical protein PPL_11805 [Heterostelium album PN500]|eukprot:XP_020426907.1 hypothetical protein PPL_11805 [Heterostelium album PN500]
MFMNMNLGAEGHENDDYINRDPDIRDPDEEEE